MDLVSHTASVATFWIKYPPSQAGLHLNYAASWLVVLGLLYWVSVCQTQVQVTFPFEGYFTFLHLDVVSMAK